MKNHHYSIFAATDNVDDLILGFNQLYFAMAENNVICEHHFRLLPAHMDTPNKEIVKIDQTAILINKRALYAVIKACLYLKQQDSKTPLEVAFSDGKNGSFSISFSF